MRKTEKLKLKINGLELEGIIGQTILETALKNGIQIPTFCYDERLEVYSACGLCLVEIEGIPKLLRSCATAIADGMVIWTDTPKVRESRKANLETLLIQHTGDCRAPCTMACPAQTDCQGYVGLIANGKIEEALMLIKETVPLAASIGRVCRHPCEDVCRRKLVEEPISIAALKRFAADIDLAKPDPYLPKTAPPTGKKVAIIGGGPGGLSCAYYLAVKGHSVTVYDAMPKMGGMLRYGIPEYNLPKTIVDKEAALIEKTGVVFRNNVRIGQDESYENLKKNNDAIIVAIGAWKSATIYVPGSELTGVYGGLEFLRKVITNEPVHMGRNIAVIGCGKVGIAVCRTAVRLGAEKVYMVCVSEKAETPVDEAEAIKAEEEGVIFKYHTDLVEIIQENGQVARLCLKRTLRGEPDDSAFSAYTSAQDDEAALEVDTIITAFGQEVISKGIEGIALTPRNSIIADSKVFTTNEKGVFAIGDCINDGVSMAIEAISHAQKAAEAVDSFINGTETYYSEPYRIVRDDLTEEDFANTDKESRAQVFEKGLCERIDSFFEIQETLDEASAIGEAARCLECGCHDYFECKLIGFADKHNVNPNRFKESVLKIEYKDNHPFILRDPNKCILCGLCIRVCDEIIGAAAIDYVNRGLNTVIRPAFGGALSETTCVACGQCISVCPTGALQERITFKKPIPLKTEKVTSICGMCAVGCSVSIESYGSLLIRAMPLPDCRVSDGILCGRGRFGINYVQKDGRITTPLIRKNGALTPVSLHDAYYYTAKKMQGIRMRGGRTAVSISHSYSVEDSGAILSLAKLLDAETFSFSNRKNGLAGVLGFDESPNTLEEVLGCSEILVFGSLLMNNQVIVSKLRRAVRNGATVSVVCCSGGRDYGVQCRTIQTKDSTAFIKQAIKALIGSGSRPEDAVGFDELKQALSETVVGDDARMLAESYKKADKAMIMFALDELSVAAAVGIADMAVISGHIGSRENGIYMLRQMPGSQILADRGVTTTAEIARGVSGLMVFGEDPAARSLLQFPIRANRVRPKEVEFLMVQDTQLTDTALSADIVFPMAAWPEISGTFVSTDKRLLQSVKAVPPPFEPGTSEIAQGIAEALGGSAPGGIAAALYPDMKFGERYNMPALRSQRFGFPDGKACLQSVDQTALLETAMQPNTLQNAIVAALPRQK